MKEGFKKCFVCHEEFGLADIQINYEVNLWVCKECRGSEKEKKSVQELLDSLADGFVCGCI